MRLAAQALELRAGRGKIARFVEQFVAEGKNLVGADYDGIGCSVR